MDPLEKFISLADSLAVREESPPPVVAVMGSFNTGKSTLINNLLGEEICPEDSLPKTTCFFYLKYGEVFSARAGERKKSLCFSGRQQLHAFLKSPGAGKIMWAEVTLNNPLLKKCTLVDTPGIDAPPAKASELEKIAQKADKIIYLFHQRGIDQLNKDFLARLAGDRKTDLRDISFWINCNLGQSDGTSLQNTGQVLRSIFRRSPEVNLFNSRHPASVDTVRRYLEISLSRDLVREMDSRHKRLDEKIPARIQKSLLLPDDALFLDSFWDVKAQAEKILLARRIINDLPRVENSLSQLLKNNQKALLLPGTDTGASHPGTDVSADIPGIKKQMSDLATKLMHDNRIRHLVSRREMGKWAGSLKREEFKVVAVGGFSSGKTTFFNALMGENILPAENRPTTSSITYIRHGPGRRAIITFKSKVTLALYNCDESTAKLCPEALQSLEKWLATDTGSRRITEIGADTGSGLREINREKVRKELKRTKQLFSAGSRTGNLDRREAGSLFRSLPAWKVKALGALREVSLVFAPAPSPELNLETTAGRNEYKSLTTSFEALRIQEINISHPARFFRLAGFVDTPGLDSAHPYHGALTSDFLRYSDAYLFFLNGKHLLNRSDSRSLLDVFQMRLKDYLRAEEGQAAAYEAAKIFFIVNFADTLAAAEREKAKNYLVKTISPVLGKEGINISRRRIFLISPLQALQGKDTGDFRRLLNEIEQAVWNYRGRDCLQKNLESLRSLVDSPLTPPRPAGKKSAAPVLPEKFSAAGIMFQAVNELKGEIHSRFKTLAEKIAGFKQAAQFKAFAWDNDADKEGRSVTHIHDFSYFRWVNGLNRKLGQEAAKWQKSLFRVTEAWLHPAGIAADPYCLPPPPPSVSAAVIPDKMEGIISASRNFYGGFKAKEARRRLYTLIREQEKEISAAVDRWQGEMEKYLTNLVTPGIISTFKNRSPTPSGETSGKKRLTREESRILAGYLSEIKEIEKKLITPGGYKDGKRQGP